MPFTFIRVWEAQDPTAARNPRVWKDESLALASATPATVGTSDKYTALEYSVPRSEQRATVKTGMAAFTVYVRVIPAKPRLTELSRFAQKRSTPSEKKDLNSLCSNQTSRFQPIQEPLKRAAPPNRTKVCPNEDFSKWFRNDVFAHVLHRELVNNQAKPTRIENAADFLPVFSNVAGSGLWLSICWKEGKRNVYEKFQVEVLFTESDIFAGCSINFVNQSHSYLNKR